MNNKELAIIENGRLDDMEVVEILADVGVVIEKYGTNIKPYEQCAIKNIIERAGNVFDETRDMVNQSIKDLIK